MKKYFLLSTFYFLLSTFHLFAQSNDWMWESSGKNGFSQVGICPDILAVDDAGNCFYTGALRGDSIHFGSYTLRNNAVNSFDIFLVKFDNNGKVVWAKQSQQNGNSTDINGYVVSTDGMGNAYIMANFSDTMSFDSYILKTQQEDTANQGYYQDNFLVKYAPDGKVVWARQSQVPSMTSVVFGNSLATDREGNSCIVGTFFDTIKFGAETLIGPINGATYTFLVKYDANGNVKWAKQSTGHSSSGSFGQSVAANNIGGVFIAGFFYDSLTFGSFKLNSPPSAGDVFLVKYDTSGNVKWARQGIIPSSHNIAQPKGITADRFGNVYVAGYFWNTLIFGQYTLTDPNPNAYNTNVFIVKYDANGNVKWAKAATMLDNNGWSATDLSCDNKGEVFMSGSGGGNKFCKICFGTDTLSIIDTANFDLPSFIVKYDSSGNVLCASIIPCGGNGNSPDGMASDTSGNYVYLGGTAETTGIFGNDTVTPYEGIQPTPFIARWRECEPTLGVPELEIENGAEVKVYPNPNNGNFTLEYDLGKGANGYVQLYNTMGQMVGEYNLANSQGKMSISNPQLSNGVYIWKLFSNNQPLKYGKVIIMK